jgi:DNA-directed RNA polymerase delta subunit
MDDNNNTRYNNMANKKTKKDSFYQMAKKVLNTEKKPMHYADITKEILKTKESKGKSPERTVMAVIIRDSHDVFMRMGDGVFGLTKLKELYSAESSKV